MVVSKKYTLRYNGTDLTYSNGFLVVSWSGGGISDVAATVPYGSGDGAYISQYRAADRQIIINRNELYSGFLDSVRAVH